MKSGGKYPGIKWLNKMATIYWIFFDSSKVIESVADYENCGRAGKDRGR